MRKLFTSCVLILAFFGVINNAVGQGPWDISDLTGACENSNVWASLNQTTGVLTITGTGCMADFWCTGAPPFEGQAQWYNENLHTIITKVIIKDNVQNIGDKAFIGCTSLTSVEFESQDVWRIGKKAFEGCSSLQTIKIPSSVTEIEGEAFRNCNNLHTVELVNGNNILNFIGYQAPTPLNPNLPCTGISPDTYNWFAECPLLTTLHLGREINNWGTSNSNQPIYYIKETLVTLTIGNTVTEIAYAAFKNCTNLKTVNIQEGNPDNILAFWNGNSGSLSDHFKGCDNLETLYLGRDLATGSGFGWANNGAPFKEIPIQHVTIGNSVTKINDNSFRNCSELTSLMINSGSNLTLIGDDAFNGCVKLQMELIIPEKVITIGKGAFNDCSVLMSIMIPPSVTEIGYEAFKNCKNLKTVDIKNADIDSVLTFWNGNYGSLSDHFKGCENLKTLYLGRDVATGSGFGYANNAAPFKESSIQHVTIGNSVTKINENSFHSCSELTSLTIISESNLNSIGNNAFNGCSKLHTELIIPEKVITIGIGAFIDCHLLPSVTIPPSVIEINAIAFKNCKSLKTVNIKGGSPNDDILEIWGDAWSPMNEHFKGCDSLETVYLDRDLAVGGGFGWSYNGTPFRGISEIRHVTIGENVTKINDNSFRDCAQLHILTFLGNNLKEIGNYAFYGCCELDTIICYPTDPPTIYQYTFGGCGKSMPNCTVYVCPNCIEAYQKADYWKEFTNYQPLGIEETPLTQLQIFPNPANSEIFIQSELQIEKVEVYSLMGTLLISENNFSEKISVSALAKGIYFLKAHTEKGLTVRKFIKE